MWVILTRCHLLPILVLVIIVDLVSDHIINVVSKASLRPKLIMKCFVARDPSVLCKAFSALLKFSSVIWNPHFKMDIINKTENVQYDPKTFY